MEATTDIKMAEYIIPNEYGVINRQTLNENLLRVRLKLEHLTVKQARELIEQPDELIEVILKAVNTSVVVGAKFVYTKSTD